MAKLDIPFIPSRGFECGQTCVAMMIKYFYPNFEPDFDEFNKIIHHVPGKYTFPLQNAILLEHYGIKAKCFSSDDIKTTSEDPGQFKRWFGKDYETIVKKIDERTYNWMVEESRHHDLFEVKITTFNQILKMFNQNILVTLIVDWNTLKKRQGPYQGHFLVLSGIDKKDILLHDPDHGPFQPYPKQLVQQAYSHPAIAHDLFVAYGKK